MIFDYPTRASHRRHGPSGYSDCERFRPWLRDEFDFRCVYCLERETWTKVIRGFEIDHVVPVSKAPELALDYDNLVYSCARCNGTKSNQAISDPYSELTDGTIKINSNAKAVGLTPNARKLIQQLDLNSPTMIEWRELRLDSERLAKSNPAMLERLNRLPNALPDLNKLRPKANSKPNGIAQSWFEQAKSTTKTNGGTDE